MGKKVKTVKAMPYKEILEHTLNNVLDSLKAKGKLTLEERPDFSVYPHRKIKGEWMTDVACLLGRPEGKNKAKLAQLIIDNLPWLQEDSEVPCPFSDFDIYPPGFICFRV